ncbi:alginate lyase family protein [Mucilaginibacter mali]|uniref:Alginate lyase family protein n=1 Tax=Mucilaginibacter mali TaxID=2740462 RepID=A0A7D4QBB7_9SPHI|nr:heparinase II/III family protein [Mucilaginibacter mali]QKJ31525.1 alginate lyase family protein [Mucilaginibacter mali]
MMGIRKIWAAALVLGTAVQGFAQQHPNIMLTKANIAAVRQGVAKYPLLRSSFNEVKQQADRAIAKGIDVPVPKDGAGGYTHEQHKQNYQSMNACGIAYQVTGDKKYAAFVKDMLLKYAAQYESWPQHPKKKSNQIPGKIFWQCLNDFVWQVYTIQAYDLVHDAIPAGDRATIEQHLFMPILHYFTNECKETFDLIHNHGTWCLSAVGMTGYVINKPDYVQMALKGSAKDGKTGFLAQLDQLFSPDGYYTEGPYYQRYAMLPFVIFAKTIQQNQPQLQIFKYHNSILSKAIDASLQLTYTNGAFFPVNDAMKDKTFQSEELVYGVDIAYADIKSQADLLDVAKQQKRVMVSDAGLRVAKDIAAGKAKPFQYRSAWLSDGNKGDEGGLGILRSGPNTDQQCILLKAASQGMGHGHFDRLNLLYYDNGGEIFSDYGSARFLNIESKFGGDYLPENKTWAKQTVAHNTLVADETSHYGGELKNAEKYHPELLKFAASEQLQVISAEEDHAYDGIKMQRTSILFKVPGLDKDLLIDVVRGLSGKDHQYDLPFWYQGHITDQSFKTNVVTNNLKALGKKDGYQHLWLNSQSNLHNGDDHITILNNLRFYTIHIAADSAMQVKLVTLGANDPNMDLRTEEKAFILSKPKAANQTFVTVTETHGRTDPTGETTTGAASNVSDLKVLKDDETQTIFAFRVKQKAYKLTINYTNKNNFIQIN